MNTPPRAKYYRVRKIGPAWHCLVFDATDTRMDDLCAAFDNISDCQFYATGTGLTDADRGSETR